MNVLLQIVFIVIFICWLIAICFKEFREYIRDGELFFLFVSFYDDVKDAWNENKWLGVIIFLFILLVGYPILTLLIFIYPCLFVNACIHRRKTAKSRIDRLAPFYRTMGDSEYEKMEEWRDSRIKTFHYEGKVPFDFDSNTYLYLENWYDKELNECIVRHLDAICKIFEDYNFRFIYLPSANFSTAQLSKANLSSDGEERVKDFLISKDTVEYTRLLCRALQIDFAEIEGGIFHFACFLYEDDLCRKLKQSRFTYFPLKEVTDETIEDFCKKYCEMIVDSRQRTGGCYSIARSSKKITKWEFPEFRGQYPNDYADYTFPIDMKNIAENIKKEIEQLKEGGYYELLLHTLGSDTVDELRRVKLIPELSRLVITDDYKIMLVDYGKEIKMTPLQKTLYIFYLRHPEGVEFKMLSAYYDELLAIYKVLSNREDLQKQEQSIRRLVDVTDNAINEKCSRIKEAFLKVADDMIAKNYYIVQNKEYYMEGKTHCHRLLKSILLPRHLVDYSAEFKQIKVLSPVDKIAAIHKNKKDLEKQYCLLNKHFFDKKYPKGKLIEEYTTFLNEYPKHYRAYFDRACLYTHVGRYKESVADNDILIEHDDYLWSKAYMNKAEALYFMKEYGLALKSANRYFELEEEPVAEGYRIRAEIYKKLKMYEEYKADMRMKKEIEDKEKELLF